jgi:hypothetical protein
MSTPRPKVASSDGHQLTHVTMQLLLVIHLNPTKAIDSKVMSYCQSLVSAVVMGIN